MRVGLVDECVMLVVVWSVGWMWEDESLLFSCWWRGIESGMDEYCSAVFVELEDVEDA